MCKNYDLALGLEYPFLKECEDEPLFESDVDSCPGDQDGLEGPVVESALYQVDVTQDGPTVKVIWAPMFGVYVYIFQVTCFQANVYLVMLIPVYG